MDVGLLAIRELLRRGNGGGCSGSGEADIRREERVEGGSESKRSGPCRFCVLFLMRSFVGGPDIPSAPHPFLLNNGDGYIIYFCFLSFVAHPLDVLFYWPVCVS
jgi:hypothetical protein